MNKAAYYGPYTTNFVVQGDFAEGCVGSRTELDEDLKVCVDPGQTLGMYFVIFSFLFLINKYYEFNKFYYAII